LRQEGLSGQGPFLSFWRKPASQPKLEAFPTVSRLNRLVQQDGQLALCLALALVQEELGQLQITGLGNLHVHRRAVDNGDGMAGALHHGSFVGAHKAVGGSLGKGALQQPEAETLRSLRLHHELAWNGGRDNGSVRGALYLLDGVNGGYADNGRAVLGHGVDGALNGGGVNQRAHCVMHQHNVVFGGRKRGQSIGHRVLAFVAAFHYMDLFGESVLGHLGLNALHLRGANRNINRRYTGGGGKGAQRMNQDRRTVKGKKLLRLGAGHTRAEASGGKYRKYLHNWWSIAFQPAKPCCNSGGGPKTVTASAGRSTSFRRVGIPCFLRHLREAEGWSGVRGDSLNAGKGHRGAGACGSLAADAAGRYDADVQPHHSTRSLADALQLIHIGPGMRLAVGLSGGADSVALLRALVERRTELGIVLHAAHLHHGLRGEEADRDLTFCRNLAAECGVEFHHARVDVAAEARALGESVEEAARRLRYAWFRKLLTEAGLDAIATAHTLDDQAETVLAKFLRGAWTEGLSGIHPVVEFAEGKILRPLLGVRRAEIESYLQGLQQPWQEDSTNRQTEYTRNRIRHELLPELESWNPQIREKLAQMAELARDEESWWQAELARLTPQLLLTGKAVRGGGRATSDEAESFALDVTRLAALAPALQRRLLRETVRRLGCGADFAATEKLRRLALGGGAGQKLELAGGLRAERSPRELRLSRMAQAKAEQAPLTAEVPGVLEGFGIRLQVETEAGKSFLATLRGWKPGDRVRLRYSSGPRKVKEVLERMRVTGSERADWPVLELDGQVVWMRGAELEPVSWVRVTALPVGGAD